MAFGSFICKLHYGNVRLPKIFIAINYGNVITLLNGGNLMLPIDWNVIIYSIGKIVYSNQF